MQKNFEEIISNYLQYLIVFIVGLLSIKFYLYKTNGLPPGPIGIPYFGYLPFLDYDAAHLQLTELSKKYGNVFSFKFTGRLYINLGSYKAVQEAHITKADCFSERVADFTILRHYLGKGFFYLDKDGWKSLRTTFLQIFKKRSMNAMNEFLSSKIYHTVRDIIRDFDETKGKPTDIVSLMLVKTSKLMQQTFLGEDATSEKEMQFFIKNYAASLQETSSTNLLIVGTFAKFFIFPFLKEYQESRNGHIVIEKLLKEIVKRRKHTYDENNIRDGLDEYFKEQMNREAKNDYSTKYFTDEVLIYSIMQILSDGVFFTGLFLSSILKALIDYPEEQEKIYQELVNVIGIDRNPELDDKINLPYTNAFISEAMRTSDVLPIFASLECTQETTISGYRIPKGAITLYNFWGAHMNPEDYDEPEKFNPARFILKNGKKAPDLLPFFGLGRRSCIAKSYCLIQAFLFLTTIVKNFRLIKPDNPVQEDSKLLKYFDKIYVCAYSRK